MSAQAWPEATFDADMRPTVRLVDRQGDSWPLDSGRWHAAVSPADQAVMERATGPVLDVGCGPGRHLGELTRMGVEAMGIDSSPAAVATARHRGGFAVHGSVFGDVPRSGQWLTILLLDGNIGIGGHPRRLLRRCRSLLHRSGRVIAEVEPPGSGSCRRVVQALVQGDAGTRFSGHWFDWATLAADDVARVSKRTGLRPAATWSSGGRWFAELAATGRA